MSGKEWRAFYDDVDYWKYIDYIDDEEIYINGILSTSAVGLAYVNDEDIILIKDGFVITKDIDNKRVSLEIFFKKWSEIE